VTTECGHTWTPFEHKGAILAMCSKCALVRKPTFTYEKTA
jgi:hypothetical protein